MEESIVDKTVANGRQTVWRVGLQVRPNHTHTLGTLRPEASWLKQIEVLNCHLLSLLLIVIVIALFASLSRHFAHYYYLCVR